MTSLIWVLIIQLKNVYFEYYSILVYLKLADQFHKLFLFPKRTKHLSLMIGYRYNATSFLCEGFPHTVL